MCFIFIHLRNLRDMYECTILQIKLSLKGKTTCSKSHSLSGQAKIQTQV